MISSVADQIIDFVKAHGAVELSEVAAHIGKDENYTKHILALLEREGLITINYRWTKFIVNWAGEQTFVPLKPGFIVLEKESQPAKGEEKGVELRKREREEEKEGPVKKTKEVKERRIEEKEKGKTLVGEVEEKFEEGEDAIFRELKGKIKEIESKRSEIEALQREREHLFEEAVVPIAARMSAEIGTLTDFLKEKERAIEGAKGRLRHFSESAEGLEVEFEKFDLAVAEARTKFDSSISALTEAISSIKRSQDEIRRELRACSEAIASSNAGLKRLEESVRKFDGRAIDKELTNLKRRVEGWGSEVSALENELGARSKTIDDLSQRVAELGGKLAALESAVSDIEQKADAAYALQATIENVRAGYERARTQFENEVARARKEIEEVRRAASARAAAEYLKEINTIERKFEEELAAVSKREEELTARIRRAKEELRQAIAEMRTLSKELKIGSK